MNMPGRTRADCAAEEFLYPLNYINPDNIERIVPDGEGCTMQLANVKPEDVL